MCSLENARIDNAVKNGKIYWDRHIYVATFIIDNKLFVF